MEGPDPDTAEPVLDGPPLALLLGALLLGALLFGALLFGALLLGALLLGAPPLSWSLIDVTAGRLGAGARELSGGPPNDDVPFAVALAPGRSVLQLVMTMSSATAAGTSR